MEKGIVEESTGSHYQVRLSGGHTVTCRIRGKLKREATQSTNPLAVGDEVHIIPPTEEKPQGLIEEVLPRRNYIIRKATKLSKQYHILASNIDQAFLLITLKLPETSTRFIDRFLVCAEAYRIPVTLLFNKSDIYSPEEMKTVGSIRSLYKKVGYSTPICSAHTGEGVASLTEQLKDKTSLFVGHSGVGKTSLLNTLDPRLNLKVGELSDVHRQGKHTTSFARMVALSIGGYVIDTPGLKGFGLFEIENASLSSYFREFFQISQQCRFHNCTHTHEPACKVLEAVEQGTIAQSRYISYLTILEGEEKYR